MKIVIDIDDEDYKRIQDISDVFNSLTSRTYSAIRNGTPLSPEWIPMKNKFPQNGQRVFISTATGKIHDVVWNSKCIHNFARNGCWYKNWFIVAWMPFFIEPYKAESEEWVWN